MMMLLMSMLVYTSGIDVMLCYICHVCMLSMYLIKITI